MYNIDFAELIVTQNFSSVNLSHDKRLCGLLLRIVSNNYRTTIGNGRKASNLQQDKAKNVIVNYEKYQHLTDSSTRVR